MPKRKRGDHAGEASIPNGTAQSLDSNNQDGDIHLRIITGSYERTLHGIHARIPRDLLTEDVSKADKPSVVFTDSFLFNAHASAIRTLALSPPSAAGSRSAQKRILATGGTDARINLYHLSAHAPAAPRAPGKAAKPAGPPEQPSAGNRSLGALHVHDAPVTALHFPSRGKLLSACAANALAVTSARDWSTLAVLRAPVPRQPNRPAGDTSTRASLPQGVNGFAVHPSRRLMLSVGRAERCLRLWNLTTGKKAGVLSFERAVLRAVGEGAGRWSGEGRTVAWNGDGERFVVGWEVGAVVYGKDCTPIGCAVPAPKTKIHHLQFVTESVLAISTEDGRIVFFDTDAPASQGDAESIPAFAVVGQMGGAGDGGPSRIKEFAILPLSSDDQGASLGLLIAAGSSDGMVRVWSLKGGELSGSNPADDSGAVKQVGTLLGEYATANRITCLVGFVMGPALTAIDAVENGHEDDGSDDDVSMEDS